MFESIFRKNSLSKGRLSEELLYEHVAKELSDGFLREGLWAKAFSLADGDEAVANAKYIKLRVQSLIDESKVEREFIDEVIKRSQIAIVEDEKSREASTHHYEDQKQPILTEAPEILEEIEYEDFSLPKAKSAIMRDELPFIKMIANDTLEFNKHLNQLVSLAELFDAEACLNYLIPLKKRLIG